MFIVQCKKLPKADAAKDVTLASSEAARAVANEFLNQGMNSVTAPDGCISMSDEPPKTIVPETPSQGTVVEDTIKSLAENLLEGHYNDPVKVIGFNTIERSFARRFRRCGPRAAPALRRSRPQTSGVPARIVGRYASAKA